jgi:hypothetical protein
MKTKTLSVIAPTVGGMLLLTALLLLLGSARAQAAPQIGLPSVRFRQQQTYTPAVTITLPAANAILTTTHLPTYTVQVEYTCGTLCIGSAMLDVVSLTVDGGAMYHEATLVSGTLGPLYVYDWPLATTDDGVSHTLIARARNLWDNIGESDPVTTYVDTVPPQGAAITAPTYTENVSFTVSWSATDGSGAVTYDVQHRRDDQACWTGWLTDSDIISRVFTVTSQTVAEGHNYAFRMLARDAFENESDWVIHTVRVGRYWMFLPVILLDYPPPVVENGDFETGDFTGWQHGGELDQSIETDEPHTGDYSALLGNPQYPEDGVPEGSAWISQAIQVPESGTPILSFWYRMFTYDVMWSDYYQSYYDYLEVELKDTSGNTLEHLLRDGFTGSWQPNTLHDLGWRNFTADLSAYCGQTVRIRFANHNTGGRTDDPRFNTYTYLDDIAVQQKKSGTCSRLGPVPVRPKQLEVGGVR